MTRRLIIGIAPFCLLFLAANVPVVRNWLWASLPVWAVFGGAFLLALASGAWLAEWVGKVKKGEGNAASTE